MSYSHLPPINWGSLLKRLTAIAADWFQSERCFGTGEEAILRGTGNSAKDLAQEAAKEFCLNASKYRPKNEEECFALCFRIMRRDFLDLVKRYEYRKTDDIEKLNNGDGELKFPSVPSNNGDYVNADAALVAHELYVAADGKQELIDLIDAVTIFGCQDKNEIAELLGISPTEVKNRRRRLKYARARRGQTVSADMKK